MTTTDPGSDDFTADPHHDPSAAWAAGDDHARGAETECSRRCGYFSSGADLIGHETREHVRCTECGRVPVDAWTAVTHKPGCPRIAPEGTTS